MVSLPTQPRQGHPCNGCGLCCLIEPCPISLEIFKGHSQVCPALEFDEGRYWCGLMRHPEQYGATLPELEAIAPEASTQYHKALIGAEVGCAHPPWTSTPIGAYRVMENTIQASSTPVRMPSRKAQSGIPMDSGWG